jgi:hypothetical protein
MIFMNGNLPLITKGTVLLFGTACSGGVMLMEAATTYTQTFTIVSGEIIVACITGFCLVKVGQLKSHINSRMDELLRLTAETSRAAGIIEGKTKERAEVALFQKGVDAASSRADK